MQPVFQHYRNRLAAARANDALPNYSDPPTRLGKIAYVSRVPFHILTKLFAPEFRPSRWRRCIATTRVTMPETAMNEDNCSPFGQYDIRPSRKMAPVQAKPQALRMVIAHWGGGKGCGGCGFLIHPADAVSSALWSE